MNVDKMADTILYRLAKSEDRDRHGDKCIVLDMKAGYKLVVTEKYHPAHRVNHHWVSHSWSYSTYSTKTEATNYFKSVESLSRAIAGNII